MKDEQVKHHFQKIRQHIAAVQQDGVIAWQDMAAALDDLQIMYEEMQTYLEVAEAIEDGLLQQNQRIAAEYYYYRELFQFAPIAYLVIDINGAILNANEAIAHLLHVPQPYLIGKPLILYVAERDRFQFRNYLNQLSPDISAQVWPITFKPRHGELLTVELYISVVRHDSGAIESLRMGVYSVKPLQQTRSQGAGESESTGVGNSAFSLQRPLLLPQSLDGLRVLVVDDEPDVCEFITALLESYGIGVRTAASAAAALQELEQFRPDVLVSDIRMPDGDGYSLIRQIRDWDAKQGRHTPAAAITAYLEEDRVKALEAGFEAYLHKLAQPTEWVELVAQLAGRGA